MLSPEDIKAQKHFLLGALLIGLMLFGINYTTGFFTRIHLQNEETMAIEHGADSAMYQQMVDELIGDNSAKMVGPLLELLRRPNDHEKYLAAKALGLLGPDAHEAIPLLQRELEVGPQEVKKVLRDALEKIDKRGNKY